MCHVPYTLTPNPHMPVKPRGSTLIPLVTPYPLPDRRYLLLTALYDHILSPQTNTSLLCVFCPHSWAPGKFLGQSLILNCSKSSKLNLDFFRDRLPKKKMQLVGISTLLILLSLGPGYHIDEMSGICLPHLSFLHCNKATWSMVKQGGDNDEARHTVSLPRFSSFGLLAFRVAALGRYEAFHMFLGVV
jgi:hypothetical protein